MISESHIDLAVCNRCLASFPFEQLRQVKSNYLCCTPCWQKAIRGYEITCERCSRVFTSYMFITHSLCYRCRNRKQIESHKVQTQIWRSVKHNLPATLTPEQWIATLEYFRFRCAYCQSRPYEILDHFVPVCRDGGTTAANCVPICKACDHFKGQKLPERITGIPKEDIDRIQAYLRQFDDSQVMTIGRQPG
jgi:hypothetical protein